jgi:hypothetical protein
MWLGIAIVITMLGGLLPSDMTGRVWLGLVPFGVSWTAIHRILWGGNVGRGGPKILRSLITVAITLGLWRAVTVALAAAFRTSVG